METLKIVLLILLVLGLPIASVVTYFTRFGSLFYVLSLVPLLMLIVEFLILGEKGMAHLLFLALFVVELVVMLKWGFSFKSFLLGTSITSLLGLTSFFTLNFSCGGN